MQWTTIAGYLVPGDVGVLPFVALGFLRRDHNDAPQNRLRRRLIVPAVVIGTGSILALLDIGLTSWALSTLIRDVFVTLSFLGLVAYVRHARLPERWVTLSVALSAVFVSAIVLAQGGYRPQATFGQVNMTAHFLATCFVLVLTRGSTRLRLITLPLVSLAVFTTSSFGALLSMGLVVAYVGYGTMRRVLHRSPALLVFMLWALIVGASGIAIKGYAGNALSNADTGSGFSSNRLERSGNGRTEIWLDGLRALKRDPLGIGPGGFKPLGIHLKVVDGEVDTAEIHHDFLGYLVERGFIGLFGLGLLFIVLWTTGQRRGATRGLLIMSVAAGFFRETLHFRHLWIFLALSVAYELGESRSLPDRKRVHARLSTKISSKSSSRAAKILARSDDEAKNHRRRRLSRGRTIAAARPKVSSSRR